MKTTCLTPLVRLFETSAANFDDDKDRQLRRFLSITNVILLHRKKYLVGEQTQLLHYDEACLVHKVKM